MEKQTEPTSGGQAVNKMLPSLSIPVAFGLWLVLDGALGMPDLYARLITAVAFVVLLAGGLWLEERRS